MADHSKNLSDSIIITENIITNMPQLDDSIEWIESLYIKFCEANTAKPSKYGTFKYGQKLYGKRVDICEERLNISEDILIKFNDKFIYILEDKVDFSESLEAQTDFKPSLDDSLVITEQLANKISFKLISNQSISEQISKSPSFVLSDSMSIAVAIGIETVSGTPIVSEWKFIVKDADGNKLASLNNARSRWFTQRLNDHGEAGFILDADDDKCTETNLNPGVNELYIYYMDELMWSGQIVTLNKIVNGDDIYWEVIAKDWVGMLSKRYVGVEATREFTTIDAGIIAKTLIEEAQAETYGDMGISFGTIESSITRSPVYDKKNLLEALKELSNQGDESGSDSYGFDFAITPNKEFNIYYPYKGTIRDDVVYRFPGNIESMRVIKDSWKIINQEWGMGKHWTGNEALVSRSDATSQNTYGRREAIKNYSDVSVLTFLQDLVWQDIQWNKDPEIIITLTARVDERVEVNKYTVGDGVTIICDKFDINEWLWVYERKVEINENDELSVKLTVGN